MACWKELSGHILLVLFELSFESLSLPLLLLFSLIECLCSIRSISSSLTWSASLSKEAGEAKVVALRAGLYAFQSGCAYLTSFGRQAPLSFVLDGDEKKEEATFSNVSVDSAVAAVAGESVEPVFVIMLLEGRGLVAVSMVLVAEGEGVILQLNAIC